MALISESDKKFTDTVLGNCNVIQALPMPDSRFDDFKRHSATDNGRTKRLLKGFNGEWSFYYGRLYIQSKRNGNEQKESYALNVLLCSIFVDIFCVFLMSMSG